MNIYLVGARDNAEPKTPRISKFLGRNAAFMGILPFRTAILGILAHPNLNSANNRCLMMNAPSFTPCAPANATFVYFDGMRGADGIPIWPHHASAELMK